MDNEDWVPIEGFPKYEVSSLGRVRHESRDDARKVGLNKKGFPVIVLYGEDNNTRYLRQINGLVARAFLSEAEDPSMTAVWHIDGDLTNCCADNLRWETRSRVLEWNEMHRSKEPKLRTPPVKHTTTGMVYNNAFECAMDLGQLESYIVWKIERQAWDMFDEDNEFRYVTASNPA